MRKLQNRAPCRTAGETSPARSRSLARKIQSKRKPDRRHNRARDYGASGVSSFRLRTRRQPGAESDKSNKAKSAQTARNSRRREVHSQLRRAMAKLRPLSVSPSPSQPRRRRRPRSSVRLLLGRIALRKSRAYEGFTRKAERSTSSIVTMFTLLEST